MRLSCMVGGTKGTFEEPYADQVAGALDQAFGAEGDWEGVPPQHVGELGLAGWEDLQRHAVDELGADAVLNLLALGPEGRGVFLPAHVRAVTIPLSEGPPLRCASLPGLREELSALADRWELPLDDEGLRE